MFDCDQEVIMYLSWGTWELGRIKSGIKHGQCKARQSPPFMIVAEAKKKIKTKQQSMSSRLSIFVLTHSWERLQGAVVIATCLGLQGSKEPHLAIFGVEWYKKHVEM